MKNILTLILYFQICIAFGQSFNVTTKDFFLNIKELIKPATKVELTHAIKHKDKFYCFFEDGEEDIKFCFVFSYGGNKLNKIEVPNHIQNTVYYDLFVNNNRIYAKTYMDSKTFIFGNKKLKWKKTKTADDLIFEDEKFCVYSLDFGEWGGKTWFKDKKTGLEYSIEQKTPLVNKIDTTYYLTSSFEVLKIENPLLLNKCKNEFNYENIKRKSKYKSYNGKSIGFETVYKDTISRDYFYTSYRPNIVSSFVWNNELLHIYETEAVTYIAKANNDSIKSIQKIGDNLSFYNWYYSYRNKIQMDGLQLLKFKTDDTFGLMEIYGNDINIYNLILK